MELTAAGVGAGLLVLFLVLGIGIGYALGASGLIALSLLLGPGKALAYLSTAPLGSAASFTLAAIPLFLLMGRFMIRAGLAATLFSMAHKWIGHWPGGLAMATVIAAAIFSAISGSSLACVAAFGPVAFEQMTRFGYAKTLSLGTIATAGTLDIMIPPSIAFVVFAMLTEVSVGKLFMGGFIPGAMSASFYMVLIFVMTRRNPSLAPHAAAAPWGERISSLRGVWTSLTLILLVLGGIYLGWVTPTEAAALGAFAALVIALLQRALGMKDFIQSLQEAGRVAAMVFLIIIGALIFGYFLAITQTPQHLVLLIKDLGWPGWSVLIMFYLLYILLGCFLDAMAIQVLTVPLVFPVVVGLGYNPIWWGVVFVKLIGIGMITPPVGMNCFVLQAVTKQRLENIFKGVLPFILCDAAVLVLITVFPQIVLFLPNMMSR